jgi:hypothetical protein
MGRIKKPPALSGVAAFLDFLGCLAKEPKAKKLTAGPKFSVFGNHW